MLYNVFETGVVYKLELQNPREAFNAIDGLEEPTRGMFDTRPDGEWERGWRITDAVMERCKARAPTIGRAARHRRHSQTGARSTDRTGSVTPTSAASIAALQPVMRPMLCWARSPVVSACRICHSGRHSRPLVATDGMFGYFHRGDYHFTVEGDRLAADSVAAFLRDQGLVPPK